MHHTCNKEIEKKKKKDLKKKWGYENFALRARAFESGPSKLVTGKS